MFKKNLRRISDEVSILDTSFTGKMLIGQWEDVELRPNKLWVIVSPLIWVRPNGTQVSITPYLITDYASIPEFFWTVLPKRSIHYDVAAAFHDDCVRTRKLRGMSLMDCHGLFKEIMKHYDTPKWQCEVMYGAVVAAGPFLRTDGMGSLPKSMRLTKDETETYKLIMREYAWSNNTAGIKQDLFKPF